jgi:hypothetical protein
MVTLAKCQKIAEGGEEVIQYLHTVKQKKPEMEAFPAVSTPCGHDVSLPCAGRQPNHLLPATFSGSDHYPAD